MINQRIIILLNSAIKFCPSFLRPFFSYQLNEVSEGREFTEEARENLIKYLSPFEADLDQYQRDELKRARRQALLDSIEFTPITENSGNSRIGTSPMTYGGKKLIQSMELYYDAKPKIMDEYFIKLKKVIRIEENDNGEFEVISGFRNQPLKDNLFTCEVEAKKRLRQAWTYHYQTNFSKNTSVELQEFNQEFLNNKFNKYLK